jgi:DNA-binding transcriptional ArsR family regulator
MEDSGFFVMNQSVASNIRFRISGGIKMATWTFLTNHAIVFVFLAKHPLITGRELSTLIGITERSVRNVISDLETEGYIKRSKEGRQVRYKISPHLPFRHQTQKDKAIRILLEALDREQIQREPSNGKHPQGSSINLTTLSK